MRREPGGDPASLASGELQLQTCFHFRKFHSFLGCFGTAPFLSLSSWDFSLFQLLGYQRELSSSPESTKEASVRLLFLTRSFGTELCAAPGAGPAARNLPPGSVARKAKQTVSNTIPNCLTPMGASGALRSSQDLPNCLVCTVDLSQWEKQQHRPEAGFLLGCACHAQDSDRHMDLCFPVLPASGNKPAVTRPPGLQQGQSSQSEKSS